MFAKAHFEDGQARVEERAAEVLFMAEVLLVDDDSSVLFTLAIALRRHGHSVTVAHDGFEARAHLQKLSFDFMVSDVRMPGLSGLELAARARTLPQPPRIILTSAYTFVEDRDQVSEAFLQKPLDVLMLSEYLSSNAPPTPPADSDAIKEAVEEPKQSVVPTSSSATDGNEAALSGQQQAESRSENGRSQPRGAKAASFPRRTSRASA